RRAWRRARRRAPPRRSRCDAAARSATSRSASSATTCELLARSSIARHEETPRFLEEPPTVSTPRIESRIRTTAPEFQENAAAMREAVDGLRRHLEKARDGGGPEARAKHTERGKLVVRDRVDGLLDPG